MIDLEFSAATYNVLADAYVRPDRYPLSPPAALAPGPRRQLLLARIHGITAQGLDLLCLQEVEASAHAAIAATLGDAWLGLYAARPRRPDGASLFVRRERFTLVDHDTLHYRSPGSDDQLALIARLRLGPHALQIACTHLQWCRDDTPADAHTGRAQLLELIDHLGTGSSAETLIAGDLNATSQSPVIQAARDRGLALGAATQRPWDTCNANRRPRKLDYLLHTAGLTPRPRPLPRLQRDTPMPSLREPSDHLPLHIDFTLPR